MHTYCYLTDQLLPSMHTYCYRTDLVLRGGLVFKAHRLLCHSTLGLRVIKKKKKKTDLVVGLVHRDHLLGGAVPDKEVATVAPGDHVLAARPPVVHPFHRPLVPARGNVYEP